MSEGNSTSAAIDGRGHAGGLEIECKKLAIQGDILLILFYRTLYFSCKNVKSNSKACPQKLIHGTNLIQASFTIMHSELKVRNSARPQHNHT